MASENGDRQSTLSLLGEAIRARLEKTAAEGQAARMYRAQAEAMTNRYQAAVKRVVDDEGGWIQVGGGGDGRRSLNEHEQTALREQAQKRALRSPLVVGYLRSMTRFVMGEGPEFVAATEDDSLNQRLDDWWARVRAVNDWPTLEDEMPQRLWRDGEVFVHESVQQTDGPIEGWEPDREAKKLVRKVGMSVDDLRPDDIPAGMIHYRLRPPGQISDPTGKVSHGIITAGADVQTVLGYVWSPDGERVAEIVPADRMIHMKIRSDSDVKRGRSQLEPILKRNKQYEDWLEYRIMLNLARTAVVLIKKMDNATGGQVSAVRDAQQDERATVANDRKLKTLKPMSTIHSSGIDYEFKSPNLDAADAAEDGRKIQLDMAAAQGIPEFMFTGDASNANFASTLVSEGPAMREFESWRDYLTPHFERMWKDAMSAAIRQGDLQGPRDRSDLAVRLQWPAIEIRDEKEHAEAQMIRHNAGILSRQTWAEDAGIDWEDEKERLDAERDEMFDMMAPE